MNNIKFKRENYGKDIDKSQFRTNKSIKILTAEAYIDIMHH